MPRRSAQLTYETFEAYDHAHLDAGSVFFAKAIEGRRCPCCAKAFLPFSHETGGRRRLCAVVCPGCGWWHLHFEDLMRLEPEGPSHRTTWWELYHAVYSEIAFEDRGLSLDVLKAHIARRWDQRGGMTAQQAEDLVAALLKEHYGGDILRVGANANASDGGIDLLIASENGQIKRAVQVKRRITRDVEAVGEVRNFVGAMALKDIDEGLFVTTASRFSPHVHDAVREPSLAKRRLKVDLIDGERLRELIEASNRRSPRSLPPEVTLDQEWIGAKGERLTSEQLFFEDLGRLRAGQSG